MSGFNEQWVSRCEELGPAGVRSALAKGTFGQPETPHRVIAEDWLRAKDAEAEQEAANRRDAREEDTLALAREANRIARHANIWAAIAALVAVIALFVAAS